MQIIFVKKSYLKLQLLIKDYGNVPHQLWWIFYKRLSDSKSPQVSRTLLSILANFIIVRVFHTSFRWLSFIKILETTNLRDSSRYSDWSKQCCSLDDLDFPSDFYLVQSCFQASRHRSNRINYNCSTTVTFMFYSLFFLARLKNLCIFLLFFIFTQ